MKLELSTRYRIIGAEVLDFGAFILFLLFLEYNEARTNQVVQNFSWVWGFVGVTLILVGLELLSLNAKAFGKSTRTKETEEHLPSIQGPLAFPHGVHGDNNVTGSCK